VIGVDTNVLLRFFLTDAPEQSAAARALFEEAQAQDRKIWINRVVLAEFLWVLTSRYGVAKPKALDLVEALLDDPLIAVEDQEAVREAVRKSGRSRQQPTDLLIAATNAARGCVTTYTFDEKASRSDGFTLLG
jgi:predicted nucleic-acid-binding protein